MLKKGDKVGIISPSNAVSKEDIKLGLEYLENLGFKCILGNNVFKKYRWMAGTEQERADDLNGLYADKTIKAIFCSAGGVGCQKFLDLIDYETVKNNPKPIFGFSDNTALQLALFSQSKTISYTGFSMKYDFRNGEIDELVSQSFESIISGKKQVIKSGETVTKGTATGKLVGGCLSLLRNLAGSKYYPNLKDKILLIEDVDEKTYQIDMMLDQIKKTKNFNKIKGIIFGTFADCTISERQSTTIDEVIDIFSKNLNIPIIKNFQYGHINSRYILPIGKKITLDSNKCEIKF